jgi:hypothetical protein
MTFEDDLLALEARVLKDAAGDFLKAVDELRSMLASGAPGIGAKLARLAIPQIEAAAKAGVLEAYQMGGDWAIGSAQILPDVTDNAVGDAKMRLDSGPHDTLVAPLTGLDARVTSAKTSALGLLAVGAKAEEALSPVFAAANTVQARIETQINASSNAASLTVGEAVKSPMVWEAERDACVYCLALAGHVVEQAGDFFPAADLYATPPASQPIVSQPPLHAHCRCRLAVLGDASYAEALQREAQRSILRGFALPSESNAARVRAASRLLDRDPIAPKSVKEYARRAVKAGKFPFGRDVPAGGPTLTVK